MDIVERIQSLCDKHGITKTELERRCGMSQNSINKWRNSTPNSITLEKVAQALHTTTRDLLGLSDDSDVATQTKTEEPTPSQQTNDEPDPADYEYPVSRIVRMPIIGIIAAGYDGEVREEHIGDVSLLAESLHGFPPEDCFVLRVSGNSMLPELKNGDLVLIHRQSSVDSGTIAAVMYDDCDATLKKVEYEPGCDWMLLVPLNPDYPTKRIEKYDLNQCRILGKLVSLVERHY